MDWNVPFVIFRVAEDGKIEEVFHAADLKMAKYWLTYIAQPGDVLCKTPLHPKHSKSGKSPEYWSHKESSGSPTQNESGWREHAEKKSFSGRFPEEQMKEPASASTGQSV